MKYNYKKLVYIRGKANYYLPALNRYLLKDGVDSVSSFQEGFGAVEKNGKWNYVRPDGTFLLKGWVNYVRNFRGGFGAVMIRKQYNRNIVMFNYVRPDGTYLLKEWVDNTYDFHKGLGDIVKDRKWYKVDKEGNIQSF